MFSFLLHLRRLIDFKYNKILEEYVNKNYNKVTGKVSLRANKIEKKI
jgi:hypothetical protein